MNEDLHDIDNLFRDGIEGHREDLPPSVWEAVSNDLDKQQAMYYKRKYYRLKRMALLLLLLCILGGVYFVFKTRDEKAEPVARKNSGSESVVTKGSPQIKRKEASLRIKEKSESQEVGEQQKQIILRSDTASLTSIEQSPTEQKEDKRDYIQYRLKEQSAIVMALPSSRQHPGTVPSERTGNEKTKSGKNKESISFSKTENQIAGSSYTSTSPDKKQSNAMQSPSHKPSVLTGRDYTTALINLKTLSVDNKSILPQANPTSKGKANAAHGFSLTAFVAPNISFDRLEDDARLAGPGRNRDEARKHEQNNFSFSTGLLLSYHLSEKWNLQSGITLTSSSTTIAPASLVAKPDNNGHVRLELHCSSGYAYITPKGGTPLNVGDTVNTSGTVSKLTYINVPASVGYHMNKGRFSFFPALGVGLNILTSGNTKTSLAHGPAGESTTTDISGLKPTYLEGQIGFGIEYGLTKKLSIGVRPNARLALTPINKETPVKSYQNFLSLETGVRIKL